MQKVKGKPIDVQTRCLHYHSTLDIIAIKLKCCGEYYPCYFCHQETTDHEVVVWSKNEWDTGAILCGACKHEMTIAEYKACNYTCPFCKSAFNPKCINHDHFYFEE